MTDLEIALNTLFDNEVINSPTYWTNAINTGVFSSENVEQLIINMGAYASMNPAMQEILKRWTGTQWIPVNRLNRFEIGGSVDPNAVKTIIAGSYNVLFLMENGSLKVLGLNSWGQLGTGSTVNMSYPYTHTSTKKITQAVIGKNSAFMIILLEDGTVRVCGQNNYGQLGFGSSDTNGHSNLTDIGLTNVKHIGASNWHSIYVLTDGTVRTVGRNNYGQCVTESTSTSQLTMYDPGLTNVKEIICGRDHNVFLLEDGTVRTNGWNSYGQCATGNTTSPQLTLYNPGLTNVKQVACGMGHTVFLLEDGTVRTVGYNSSRQCATLTGSTNQLTLYDPGLTNVKQVACGQEHTIFLFEDGTVRTIGLNYNGQCATGNTNTPQTTLYDPGLTNVKQVACADPTSYFLLDDGTLRAVGNNASGQCGIGNTTHQLQLCTPLISTYL